MSATKSQTKEKKEGKRREEKGRKRKEKGGKREGKFENSCWQLWMLSYCWATAQLLQRLLSTQAAEAAVPLQLKNSGYATDLGVNVEKLPNGRRHQADTGSPI
jgi:hypothetical protein